MEKMPKGIAWNFFSLPFDPFPSEKKKNYLREHDRLNRVSEDLDPAKLTACDRQ